MSQFGSSLFDKAISADAATIKRSENEILETSTELKDLNSSRDNLLSASGSGGKDTMKEVADTTKNLQESIGANLDKLTSTAVKK